MRRNGVASGGEHEAVSGGRCDAGDEVDAPANGALLEIHRDELPLAERHVGGEGVESGRGRRRGIEGHHPPRVERGDGHQRLGHRERHGNRVEHQ